MEAKQNDTATLENNVAVDHKTKHTLTIQVCNHAPLNLLLFGPFMLLLVDLSSLASKEFKMYNSLLLMITNDPKLDDCIWTGRKKKKSL